jgi:hypothetical protein
MEYSWIERQLFEKASRHFTGVLVVSVDEKHPVTRNGSDRSDGLFYSCSSLLELTGFNNADRLIYHVENFAIKTLAVYKFENVRKRINVLHHQTADYGRR